MSRSSASVGRCKDIRAIPSPAADRVIDEADQKRTMHRHPIVTEQLAEARGLGHGFLL
jgi:hypothetical protein